MIRATMTGVDIPGVSRRTIGISLSGALVGGVVGWLVVFSTVNLLGLVVGVIASGVVLVAGRPLDRQLQLTALAGYTFAFALLTWPFLWIACALITGTTLGN